MRQIITEYYESISAGVILFLIGTLFFAQLDLEHTLPYLDKVLHVTGGFIVAWFFSLFFYSELANFTSLKKILLLVSTVALIGVVWEFAEFLSGAYSPHYFPALYKYFHGGDLIDTLLDLVADLVGGACYSLYNLYQ